MSPCSPSLTLLISVLRKQFTQDIFAVYLAIADKSFYFHRAICEKLYFPTFPRNRHQDHNRFVTATLQSIVYFCSF